MFAALRRDSTRKLASASIPGVPGLRRQKRLLSVCVDLLSSFLCSWVLLCRSGSAPGVAR
ncbi:hypothetical protein EXIGLDRAFT_724281 [Exidia glandulosa HHB12029]|uniref:Uncharacterized protein n=1 Tax=Exidia glandulosa HHB12029 TaxID=1314781 RepID=A0A165MTF3_EXIGL|nr:hypothetical protein EXIGLDRAFT_724281 [Exidia glandulosa HHB12029]